MGAPNEQNFVDGNLIVVTLIAATAEASIAVSRPPAGPAVPPQHVNIKPFLDAGLSERDALKRVMEIASIAVQATSAAVK
ncbi:hypothetical protein [Paraburkholderia piptadeniae]|uniref:hypothetical protein n=1 Tax=Paraburkholderia piptadeniae TaxID=1701573 RepID=UPI00117FC380|nr:hypothetical protein [Paraburkholderia piptadeniae]